MRSKVSLFYPSAVCSPPKGMGCFYLLNSDKEGSPKEGTEKERFGYRKKLQIRLVLILASASTMPSIKTCLAVSTPNENQNIFLLDIPCAYDRHIL